MLITKARHDRIVAEKNAVIDDLKASLADAQAANDSLDSVISGLREDNTALTNTNYALDRTAAMYKAERDRLKAELAPLKAARDKRLANLADANARRKQEAEQRNGAMVQ